MRKATIGSVINNRRLMSVKYTHNKQRRWTYQCLGCNTVSSGSLQNLKVIGCMYCKRLATKNAMLEALKEIPISTPMYKWAKLIKAKQKVSTAITPVQQEIQATGDH
jgi:hypothetical protein